MHNINLFKGGVIVLALSSTSAFAQQSVKSTDEDINSLEEVTITTHRSERRVVDTGASVTVFDRDDILARQQVMIADLLRSVPGVTVSRSGGVAGVTSLRLRGAEAGQTLVMINGIKVNDLSSPTGGYNFANLDSSQVQRIEVVRGPQSVMWGSDAIGGVVNITTGSNKQGISVSGDASWGSFDTKNLATSVGYGGQMMQAGFAAKYYDSDGISVADSVNGNTEKDGHKNITIDGWLDMALSDESDWAIEGSVRLIDVETEYDQFDFTAGIIDGDNVSNNQEVSVGINVNGTLLDGRFFNRLKASYSDIVRDDLFEGALSLTSVGKRKNLHYFGELQLSSMLSASLGAEYEEYDIDVESFGEFASLVEGRADIKSVMGELFLEPQQDVSLSFGARVDDHETFGTQETVRVLGSWRITEMGTRGKAGFSTGFKAPTLYQLYSAFGDQALQPETAKSFEIGIEQDLPDGWGQASVTYFDRTNKNQIDFSFETFLYANLNKSKANGVETALMLTVTEALSVDINYTNQSAKDVTSQAQLLRRPKNVLNGDIRWQLSEEIQFGGSVYYSGSQEDVSGSVAAYTLVGLRASYKLYPGYELYGRVDNLTNKQYQEIIGFGTPGRAGYIGLRAEF